MAFDLPRAARSLRFTGQVRALVSGGSAKRQAARAEPRGRERREPPAPPPVAVPSTALLARPRAAPPPLVRDPYANAPNAPARHARSAPPPGWDDDEVPTTVAIAPSLAPAPLPRGGRDARDRRAPAPPIPNFRPAAGAPAIIPRGQHQTTTAPARHRRLGLPLAAWLVLSFVSAVISYRLVPPVIDQLGRTTQALAR